MIIMGKDQLRNYLCHRKRLPNCPDLSIAVMEVTSFAFVCVLQTVFPCVRRTRNLVCAVLFNSRRGTVASCFASVTPSVYP